ncbi:MAG TPA: hypothetical protein DCL40_00835 [Coxiellaceae bacterium]|nr:hypothetical protein [Coxiellaceae bacterium]
MTIHSKDSLQRFMLTSAPVRGTIVRVNQSLQTVLAQHHYPLAVEQVLTEALIANLLLTSTMRWEGKLIMQFQSTGCLSLLVTQATHKHHITGMAQWNDPLPSTDSSLLGSGQLITSVLHNHKAEPDQSIIPLHPQGLTESLQDYFERSVQLPTKLWISGHCESAYGVLLQVMPSPSESFDFSTFIESLDENALDFTQPNTAVLRGLLLDQEYTLYDEESVHFGCSCSLQKMQQAIIAMGETEARQALEDTSPLIVQCDFCNDQYAFTLDEIESLFPKQQ